MRWTTALLIIPALLLLSTAAFAAGPSETVVTGNIDLSGTNSGTITSIGGGKLSISLGDGIASAGANIGSAEDTETNVNSIIIYSGTTVHGNISLKGTNTGTITNVGSKVNVNSIILGK